MAGEGRVGRGIDPTVTPGRCGSRGLVSRRRAGALLAVCLAGPGAASADSLWEVFAARCLAPYEAVEAADLGGLDAEGRDGGIAVAAEGDTCTATGGTPGDLGALLEGRVAYEEVAPGVWQSDRWREPRIEVEAIEGGYSVRETNLEG